MQPIARRSLGIAASFALVAGVLLVAAPVAAGTGSATLTASAPIVDFVGAVTLSGELTDVAGCLAGRSVKIEWRAADSTAFATVGQATTDGGGSFATQQQQISSGTYRAMVLAAGACDAVTTPDAAVAVRAFVDSAFLAGDLSAGSCVEIDATVSPPKPGQTVELQRRRRGRWTTIETLTLDPRSQVSTRPCFGWRDIGVVRMRARWTAQDALNATSVGVTAAFRVAEADWMRSIDRLVGRRAISVAVGEDGSFLYEHEDATPRAPASNEKLLLSMALLDARGPDATIPTSVAARGSPAAGVLKGNLWILGQGDPQVGRGTMAALARRLAGLGLRKVTGRVMGSTGYFRRDWDALGWNDVARRYVDRPTALTFEHNVSRDPERSAAAVLIRALEKLGVRVAGKAGAGSPPSALTELASVDSRPLRLILAKLLRPSDNFYAEVLGKGLGADRSGPPGTIAKGAAAISAWLADHGEASFEVHDASGLSYADRVTAEGLVELLWGAEGTAWGAALRRALPTGGQGTLEDRFPAIRIRAKTGSLTSISALSGWVWSSARSAWIEFSILSKGMDKPVASALEDRIVQIVHANLG